MSKDDAILLDKRGALYFFLLYIFLLCVKMGENTNWTYYQKNRDVVLSKAKDYYKNNKDILREKARDKYRNLSEEEKI